ncbi:hypothetical protein QT397_10170 [Microbulbifer sp. MKSA007]|uniref:hypothetical protein n=1 Tax=Microbulbifer sp. EKSA005 TaxID=3243364 RepID=UPI002B31195F|nr:hypothetical protein QT397_10170 [Microbulbifer sp. MKSA007]
MVKSLFLVLFGTLIGSIFTYWVSERKDDSFAEIRPANIYPRACIPADEKFKSVFDHLEALYGLALDTDLLTLKIGIEKQLSNGFFEREGGESKYICKPEGLYKAVERLLADEPVHPTPDLYQLRLYAKLENPSDNMLEGISKVAFRKQPYYVKTGSKKRQDPRPIAMTTLAQHGERAKPYASHAYHLIDHRTLLGTSAAQVAAAANYADSLSKIESAMFKILDEASGNAPLDFNQYDRFRQLSYALMLSEEEGRNHTDAIEALMDRKVYAWGGWFGRLAVDPKHMCQVMNSISPENTVTERYEYCSE